MKKIPLNTLLKKTRQAINKLRNKVEDLKHKQEESYEREIKEPSKPKSEKMQDVVVHFSAINVAKCTLVILGLILLEKFFAEISDILLIFFISLLFSAAIDPTVDYFEKKKVPRSVSVIAIFIILISLLVFFISQLIPLVATQLIDLAVSLNNFVNNISTNGFSDLPFGSRLQPVLNNFIEQIDKDLIVSQVKHYLETIGGQLQSFAGDTFAVIKAVFNGIFNFILVLIITFFLTVDEKGVNGFLISLFPSKHASYILKKTEAVKIKIGYWLRGQIILMFVMFALSLIGLLILGVDYALTLAMMVGIGELIPVLGPLLSGIPAVLVGFNESAWLALWIIILYIVLQQLEGHIIVPLVMKKVIGLSPIIIIISMLIGFSTLQILGMIIAIPVATALSIFVMDYTRKEK